MGRGKYQVYKTVAGTKMLILDKKNAFAWIYAGRIGEILVESHAKNQRGCILASGAYRLYQVVNERRLTDQLHLELNTGDGIWQGYLLPTGLPSDIKKKNRIIPTQELITSPRIRDIQGHFD